MDSRPGQIISEAEKEDVRRKFLHDRVAYESFAMQANVSHVGSELVSSLQCRNQ